MQVISNLGFEITGESSMQMGMVYYKSSVLSKEIPWLLKKCMAKIVHENRKETWDKQETWRRKKSKAHKEDHGPLKSTWCEAREDSHNFERTAVETRLRLLWLSLQVHGGERRLSCAGKQRVSSPLREHPREEGVHAKSSSCGKIKITFQFGANPG